MNDHQSIGRITRPVTVPPLLLHIGRYASTDENGDVVRHAFSTYAHLLRENHVPGNTTRIDFSQFADLIQAFLGTLDESQRHTVQVLRNVHTFNATYALPDDERAKFDKAIWVSDIPAAAA